MCAYNICAIINDTGKYSFRQLPYYVMLNNRAENIQQSFHLGHRVTLYCKGLKCQQKFA